MELISDTARVRWKNTCRLIPSRYPTTGVLDRVASRADLALMFELEAWTNDRLSDELNLLHKVPVAEWVTGPQASVIMAAYCHPRLAGGRFNGPERGAWYAARKLATAQAEIVYHRTAELAEIGVFETRLQMRLYLADFNASFYDLRSAALDRDSYAPTQTLAADLLERGSNGVLYRSVRDDGGECIACFRPKLVGNVRPDAHFEYRWTGTRMPSVRRLQASPTQ